MQKVRFTTSNRRFKYLLTLSGRYQIINKAFGPFWFIGRGSKVHSFTLRTGFAQSFLTGLQNQAVLFQKRKRF